MFKLFAFVSISTQMMLKVDEVAAAAPSDGETEKNDVSKEDNEMKPFPHREKPWFSLNCVLFKDLGCDSECFIIADAFGYLGAGICVEDYHCDCGYAIHPSLNGIWEQKFPHSGEILNQIIASNDKLAKHIHMILAQGFKTSSQSKYDLKPYLSETQFDELVPATDTMPANKIIPSVGYTLVEIQKHVDEKLPIVLKWLDDDLTAARGQYKHRLMQALEETKNKSYSALERIVHLVCRVDNEALKNIVNKYLKQNNYTGVGPEYEIITGIDKISYVVVDELVKRVDKGTFQFVVGWVSTKFKSLLNKFRTTDNDRSVREVLATPGSISHDWRKNGITIRYRRNQRGDVNLAWVKNSDRVCISIYAEDAAVSQSWMFGGKFIISLFRSPEGGFTQDWDFGSLLSYQKHDKGPFEGEWFLGIYGENLLGNYKKRIDEWCTNNDFLIDRKFCIIYKN